MSELYKRAEQFRAELLGQEESARQAILEAYRLTYLAISQDIEQLVRFLIESGDPVTAAQLERLDRWQSLLRQIEAQISLFGASVQQVVAQGQSLQLARARAQAEELIRLGMPGYTPRPGFSSLAVGPLQELVGNLQDGTPVAESIKRTFPALADRVKAQLITGVGTGKNPRQVARKITAELEPPVGRRGQGTGPLASALRIARTEILRAHREASRATYNENADVLRGWIWLSARGTHVCAACLAMDGTTHPLDAPMGSHPNCRCTMLPWIIGDPAPTDTGEAWLKKQSPDVQAQVLGRSSPDPEAAKAFRAGRVSLAQFVDERHSDTWGTTRTAKSFKQVQESNKQSQPPPPAPKLNSPPAPKLDPLSEQLFGSRSVTVTRGLPDRVREVERELFGRALTDLDYAELVGAPAGAGISVYPASGSLEVEVDHPWYKGQQERIFSKDADGKLWIYNSFWKADSQTAPKGLATRVLARQVWYAQKLGVDRIEVHAYGDPKNAEYNGYYTWPRLGFELAFDAGDLSVLSAVAPWPDVKTLQDIFAKPDGPQWWRDFGWDTKPVMRLQEGARSLTMHRQYLKERQVVAYVD